MPPLDESRNISHWDDAGIRRVVQERFGVRACHYQLEVAKAIYSGQHVIGCAPTGAGKTLSFWIAMLMAIKDGIKRRKVVTITPLNLLGQQMEIERGNYDAIITNPEMLVGNKAVRELFRTQRVASTLLCFVLDEGHCVSQWASFRQHYKNLGDLHYTIPGNIPFYIASATLPSNMLDEIIDTLNLKEAAPTKILYSNDRPEISLSVKVMVNKANSYHDLDFLIPNDFSDRSLMPRKFLVFFDNTTETREAILHLRKRQPPRLTMKSNGSTQP
ncbi:hypothetical protein AGABI2DRAFT_79027 [Agaricus bisporus var. bisporus H97]|uniref:hypothetical protein n=1 Tax=Agaricus bisporus var. bisporus (strain H97 / ATCC MYA-4626 / FGSC 10389) TaxID=936046 RepID=UPI00029F6EDE|nr:hypothetical protein AGABI2DRAFT_79027 [Agaricus bisporus var. bisporus H97]EKV42173.1 hypothetical protein AGABI2DRAFT_79027 [Agaricus bisporus var. bisporus H97]